MLIPRLSDVEGVQAQGFTLQFRRFGQGLCVLAPEGEAEFGPTIYVASPRLRATLSSPTVVWGTILHLRAPVRVLGSILARFDHFSGC